MEVLDLKEEFVSGTIALLVALVATYGVSNLISTSDLEWALIAVGCASFFSGFFGRYFGEK